MSLRSFRRSGACRMRRLPRSSRWEQGNPGKYCLLSDQEKQSYSMIILFSRFLEAFTRGFFSPWTLSTFGRAVDIFVSDTQGSGPGK